jgi:hypothetical protein
MSELTRGLERGGLELVGTRNLAAASIWSERGAKALHP